MTCGRFLEIVFSCLVVLNVALVECTPLGIQSNGPCTTPNGEKATCVSLFTCPVIFNAIRTKNETAKRFAKLSRCGQAGKVPLVCCGSLAYLQDDVQDYIVAIYDPDAPEGHRLQPSVISKDTREDPVVFKEYHSDELPDRNFCGVHSSDDRIFGGEWTAYDEFPWLVALESKRKRTGGDVDVRCGGSLINKKFVLTAAHCAVDKEFELINARLGDWNLTSDPDCAGCDRVQVVKIAEVIPHRYYSELTKNNDIALLRLEKEIKYSDFIRPICLPPANLPPAVKGTKLAVSGWGAIEGKSKSAVKLKVNVPLVLNDDCNKKLPNKKVEVNQMCAGGIPGKDACRGDSGGPLIRSFVDTINNRVQWYQEGIVSRGVECGLQGYPGVYTRLSRYISWIIYNIDPAQ